MYYNQIVAPISYPLSLDDAKEFMRISDDDDNNMIQAMITASTEYAENYTNRQLESATFELYNDCFVQDMKFPKNPINSISKIEYMDEDGNYQTLADTEYYLYGENDIFRLYYEDMPSHKTHKNAIKITFVSGYTTVPESIIAYLKVKVSTLYENREQFVIGVSANELPLSFVDNLLDKYRIQPL